MKRAKLLLLRIIPRCVSVPSFYASTLDYSDLITSLLRPTLIRRFHLGPLPWPYNWISSTTPDKILTISEPRLLLKMSNETWKRHEGMLLEASHWIIVDHKGHIMIKQKEWLVLFCFSLWESSLVWWEWESRENLVCFLELVSKLVLAMICYWEGNLPESRWIWGKPSKNYIPPPTLLWVSIYHPESPSLRQMWYIFSFICSEKRNDEQPTRLEREIHKSWAPCSITVVYQWSLVWRMGSYACRHNHAEFLLLQLSGLQFSYSWRLRWKI